MAERFNAPVLPRGDAFGKNRRTERYRGFEIISKEAALKNRKLIGKFNELDDKMKEEWLHRGASGLAP